MNDSGKRYKIDLQLKLYGDILKTDFLHYGYWENPSSADPGRITLQDLREAQVNHAKKVASLMPSPPARVLDVGGGMGGFGQFLLEKGYMTDVLTPDGVQIEYIKHKHPRLKTLHGKFEDMDISANKGSYDAVVMLESCQYINPDRGLSNARELLKENGKLLVSDYFKYDSKEKDSRLSGHGLKEFNEKIGQNGLKLVRETDITDNVIPTMLFIRQLSTDFGLPLYEYITGKFRMRFRLLHFLLRGKERKLRQDIEKRLLHTDPDVFKKTVRYRIMEISKAS